MHRHEPQQLRLDLFDDHRRAGGDDGDAREVVDAVGLGDGQALDVVAAAREQADDTRQNAGLVVYENRDGVFLDGAAME